MSVLTDFLQFAETAITISMLSFAIFLYVKTKDELVLRNLIVVAPIALLFLLLYIYDYFASHYVPLILGDEYNLTYAYAIFSVFVMATVTMIVAGLTRYGIELFPIKRYIKKITWRSVVAFIFFVFALNMIFFMYYFGNNIMGAIGAAINLYYPLASLGVVIIAIILVFQYASIEDSYDKKQAKIFIIAFVPQLVYTLLDVFLLGNYYLQATHLSYTVFSVLAFYQMSTHVFINYEVETTDYGAKGLLQQDLGLTERESEVARMLVEGALNRELANQLNISENTVKTHIKNIYRKLGVNNRLQLIHRLKSEQKKEKEQ